MSLPILCSFVGIDTQTDVDDLISLAHRAFGNKLGGRPKTCSVEWGLLYSPSRAGKQKRYPSFDFIENFFQDYNQCFTELSLPLCGSSVEEYFLGNNSRLMELIEEYDPRIQLNFSMEKYDTEVIVNKITNRVNKQQLIVQSNKSKQKFIKQLLAALALENNVGAVDILYDGSGGFGREIETVDKPYEGYFTGYAGGIKPENVEKIVKMIDKVTEADYYIDMESGVRTDDWLDIKKCTQVIEVLEKLKSEESFS